MIEMSYPGTTIYISFCHAALTHSQPRLKIREHRDIWSPDLLFVGMHYIGDHPMACCYCV